MKNHGVTVVLQSKMKALSTMLVYVSIVVACGCSGIEHGSSPSQSVAYVSPDNSIPEIQLVSSIWTNAQQFARTPQTNGVKLVYMLELGFPLNRTTEGMYKSIRPGLIKLGWKPESGKIPHSLYSKGDRMLEVGFHTGMHPTDLMLIYWKRGDKETPNQ